MQDKYLRESKDAYVKFGSPRQSMLSDESDAIYRKKLREKMVSRVVIERDRQEKISRYLSILHEHHSHHTETSPFSSVRNNLPLSPNHRRLRSSLVKVNESVSDDSS
jgi:hypothetical protein